jgi:PST family polysaccharide transporter
MIVMQIGNYAALQGDTFAVGRLLGSEALGAYGRAYQLMAVPATMLGGVVDRILYPTLCRAREHKRFFRRELIRVTGRFAAILLPTSVCLLIIGPELVLGLLGPMWVTAVTPFQILVSVLYFRAAYKVGDCAIRAIGQVYNAALRHWIYAGMVICGAVLGSLWGLKGVAAGVSIAIALNWVSIFSLVCSAAGVSSRLFLNAHVVGIVLSIVVGILTSAVVGMLRPFDSALLTICSALLVLAGVLGLGGTLLRQSSEARRLARLTSHAR